MYMHAMNKCKRVRATHVSLGLRGAEPLDLTAQLPRYVTKINNLERTFDCHIGEKHVCERVREVREAPRRRVPCVR